MWANTYSVEYRSGDLIRISKDGGEIVFFPSNQIWINPFKQQNLNVFLITKTQLSRIELNKAQGSTYTFSVEEFQQEAIPHYKPHGRRDIPAMP
jgi:hypothetical protein